MHGGVRGIIELLEDDGAGRSVAQGFGLGNGTRHTFGTRCQDNLRTQRLQQVAAFETHRLGHGKDEAVALDSGYHSQSDARIAAGGLDERSARTQQAARLGILDHGQGGTCLDAA